MDRGIGQRKRQGVEAPDGHAVRRPSSCTCDIDSASFRGLGPSPTWQSRTVAHHQAVPCRRQALKFLKRPFEDPPAIELGAEGCSTQVVPRCLAFLRPHICWGSCHMSEGEPRVQPEVEVGRVPCHGMRCKRDGDFAWLWTPLKGVRTLGGKQAWRNHRAQQQPQVPKPTLHPRMVSISKDFLNSS